MLTPGTPLPPATLDATIAALADPARRQVIDMLKAGPRRAGEIAEEAGMSGPAMSRHLRQLRRAHLIVEERVEEDARVKLYRLAPERFEELQGWLEEVRAFWTGSLGALKAHAEAKAGRRRK
ncbi:ArsR/SmtB family transcription factor [Tepidicaulis sp. LMO-SS28]|uniref:ArsR/SmtB family transcription factor n=1 Tax=Tepidicaulis sp. LMO-SS28 TaxID=3447455 RepID=UPI003EE12CB5